MLSIIDYGSGNLHSVQKACEHVAHGMEVKLVQNAEALRDASHILLPGVGAYGDCIKGLRAVEGMIDALEEHVQHKQRPFLGICVGMQMLFEQGFEHGEHEGLGWLQGEVQPLKKLLPTPQCDTLPIPHMGWNSLQLKDSAHPFCKDIHDNTDVYFVHSYAATQHDHAAPPHDTLATTEYGATLCAAVAKDNILGTQFHPEKSQTIGLKFLENFVTM